MQDPDEFVLEATQERQLVLAVPLQVKQVLSQETHDPETSVVPSLQRQVLLLTSITLGSEQVRQ
jgi:hypothetical protein